VALHIVRPGMALQAGCIVCGSAGAEPSSIATPTERVLGPDFATSANRPIATNINPTIWDSLMSGMDDFGAQLRAYLNKTAAYFSALPDKDPPSLYSWIAIGVGIVLIIVAFVFF
jgi:hypothetical protein